MLKYMILNYLMKFSSRQVMIPLSKIIFAYEKKLSMKEIVLGNVDGLFLNVPVLWGMETCR